MHTGRPLRRRRPMMRALVLLLGLLLPQFILYGPSLIGRKILLPLDLLTLPGNYIPATPGADPIRPFNPILSDTVLQYEPTRRYTVSEVRAGRLPLWSPMNYCGAPLLAANQPAIFSPYRLLDYAWDGPIILAWRQVAIALVAGVGAYCYFRHVLHAGFAAACIGAWCWPLCGFLTLWTGFTNSPTATWLPWILLSVEGSIRRPGSFNGILLAIFTAAALVSGHSGVAAQLLLCAGLYAVGRLPIIYGLRGLLSRRALGAGATLIAGWGLGILLAAPQILPTADYISRGYRVAARLEGYVETPPAGWSALPQLLFPYFRGDTSLGLVYTAPNNRLESAAAGYAGLLMALVWAPLGWRLRRHRALLLLWLVLAVIGVTQVLDLPLLSQLLKIPPLNTFRNNRLVLITGFAITCCGVAGLDVLRRHAARRRALRWSPWFVIPPLLLLLLATWSLARAASPPAGLTDITTRLHETIRTGASTAQFHTAAHVDQALHSFSIAQTVGALTCLLAVAIWLTFLLRTTTRRPWFLWTAGTLTVAELLLNAWKVFPQSDPSLYYPEIPAMAQIAKSTPGRVVGFGCLPAVLNLPHRLPDIRGYDASDPARLVEFLNLFPYRDNLQQPTYAATQNFVPDTASPLFDAAAVRYVIFRGKPLPNFKPVFTSPDYWVLENPSPCPRAYIPSHAVVVNDKTERLAKLKSLSNPRELAYVESPDPLPPGPYYGEVRIAEDSPNRITLDLDMRSAGLVILADLFEPGWHADLAGRELPILPANHAFRGVVVPPGKAQLTFTYAPAPFTWGLRCAAAAAILLAIWVVILLAQSRTRATTTSDRASS